MSLLIVQVGGFTIGYLREVEASLGGDSAPADKDAAEAEATEEVTPEVIEVIQPAKPAAETAVVIAVQKKPFDEMPVCFSVPCRQ